jgi:cytochrome oxidase Cu insertion factor (SCO1/SenC/PrrC family)
VIRRTGIVVTALALLIVGSAGAAPDFASFQVQPYQPPKAAPAFSLPALDGRTVRLEDFRGKVLLLFFWATW